MSMSAQARPTQCLSLSLSFSLGAGIVFSHRSSAIKPEFCAGKVLWMREIHVVLRTRSMTLDRDQKGLVCICRLLINTQATVVIVTFWYLLYYSGLGAVW